MNTRWTLGLSLCLALAAAPAEAARTLGSLSFEPCTLAPTLMPVAVDAQCTTLEVPEDRARPDGRRIELAIAWVPAESKTPQPDPVFMLAGGPGQAAREAYPMVAGAFRDVLRRRHVILVDQRGTGASNPLRCEDAAGASAVTETEDYSAAAVADFARRCLATLDADPRFYTTGEAVQDLDAVRAALGAERIDLVGISYGTRVAQEYLRRFPQRTRAVVLDGVVPPTLVLGSEHARNLEASLDLQFARCAQDATCAKRLGSPRQNLDALFAKLREAPPQVRFRDPLDNSVVEETLSPGAVAAVVRLYAYTPTIAAMLPLSLHEAANGRPEMLAAQARMLVSMLGESIMHGMQLSVICTEDVPALEVNPADAGTVIGNAMIEVLKAQCAVWPAGTVAPDFHAPLASDAPVLLISGEFDPVTPPRYGETALAQFANGRHLVLRGQGHNVVGTGCMPRLLGRFIDSADAKALDAKCLEQLDYTPPFAGYHGWEP